MTLLERAVCGKAVSMMRYEQTINMRIGIDARMMGAENTRGIGRYIEEMIHAMLEFLHEDETLVLFERAPENSPIQNERVEHVQADMPWYGWQEQIQLPKIIQSAHIDILWVPHWNIPIGYRGPLVVTIHDLLLINQKHSTKISTRHPIFFYVKYLAFRIVLYFATKKANRLFPPTETIREEIMYFSPETKTKLTVTGEGLGHIAPSAKRLFDEPYLLYVGSAYPHKRLDLALSAWQEISQKHPSLHFLIAGEKDLFMKRYMERVKNQSLSHIHFLDAISDAELAAYMSHAEGLVFPSEYEGFGLPPLEALLCGTPAVVADIPVMKEVLPKEGVFFFHKGNVNDMIRMIESVLLHGQNEEEMQRAAHEIRQRHTWHKAASCVLTAMRGLLKKEDVHDEKKGKTRRDADMEKDERQSRTGTPA